MEEGCTSPGGASGTTELNTVVENSANTEGSGIVFAATNMAFRQGIVAFNTGSAGGGIFCSTSSTEEVDCCVVFGNSGSDAICASGGSNNVMADPQFCGELGSNYYWLQSDSPAAPAQSACNELIGALPVGCTTTPTEETSWGQIKKRY